MSYNRDSTPPLWSNVPQMGGLTFNSGNLPSLLVPLNTSNTPPIEGEADHFMGQESPPGHGSPTNSAFTAKLPSSATSNPQTSNPSLPTHSNVFSTPANQPSSTVVSWPNQAAGPPAPVSVSAQQPLYYPSHPNYTGFPPPQSAPTVSDPTPSQTGQVPMYNPSDVQVSQNAPTLQYVPINHHWFYCKTDGDSQIWMPFSYQDSMSLEESYLNGCLEVVAVLGGRYDVDINARTLAPIYWSGDTCEVRRCSWFYRNDNTSKFVPYSEVLSDELEDLYMNTMQQGTWHKKNEVSSTNDIFVFHSPTVFVQFGRGSFPDEFGVAVSESSRPKVVKRGATEIGPIADGELPNVDHLIFVVHGIGPVCDLRFRGIVECVDDMRDKSVAILSSHFKSSQQSGSIGRVEYLPIYWHDCLRSDAVGVESKLGKITLPSIKKLRDFTNDTLLDILFYNSPLYSQTIVEKIGSELNRLYNLFRERNPTFGGEISLAGHSLGSLVLFDLLSMQGSTYKAAPVDPTPDPVAATAPPEPPTASPGPPRAATPASETSRSQTPEVRSTPVSELHTIETMSTVLEHLQISNLADKFHEEQIDLEALLMCEEEDLKSIGIPLGPRKKILRFLADRTVAKNATPEVPDTPIAPQPSGLPVMSGLAPAEMVSLDRQNSWFVEGTSSKRVEFIAGLHGVGLPAVSYPQLDFAVDKFFCLGSPIALFLTIRGVDSLSRDFSLPTCNNVFNIFHPYDPVAYRIEPLINPDIRARPVLIPHHKGRKRLHIELKENLAKYSADIKGRVLRSLKSTWSSINEFARAHVSGGSNPGEEQEALDNAVDQAIAESVQPQDSVETESVMSSHADEEVEVGSLNQGRRIDYVLQEAPLESFNDYLFALSSHLVYWESEDVALMMMKEVYSSMNVTPDAPIKPSQSQTSLQNFSQSPPILPPPVSQSQNNTTPLFNVPPISQSQASFSAPPMGSTNQPPPSGFSTNQFFPTSGFSTNQPPPTSGFVPSGPPPKGGFVPRK